MLNPVMSWRESRERKLSARDVINRASMCVRVQCVSEAWGADMEHISLIWSPQGNLLEVQMCAEISAD